MKYQRSGQVLREVDGVMASRVDMELVRDAALGEHLVECPRAGIKAKVVFVSTIEIDLHARKICRASHGDRAVLLPEGGIGRIAEDTPSSRERGESGVAPARKVGSLLISAALWALTDEKSWG